ncbi:phospholipid/cholesterol/gamma-HCH transport system permease protein [Haloechinothrix alba]|uniref:Phospholipid/cholesterol/gamma-HCH transport system permease protein n=1 Tax=Haloechinothrix alba TaxID=664784 RepID=A0A238XNH5_9PSEU|nr:ABC transporter permease [Haloechinothrix alba]SNR60487.1 phospholipid/cholesterol/gamma-HCH transport system permease protein [Haloechinothrix alba]
MRVRQVDQREQGARGISRRGVGGVPEPVRSIVVQVGEIIQLAARVLHSALRYPRGYWRDVVDECYVLVKKGLVPSFATVGFFTFVVSAGAYGILSRLGAEHLMAQFTLTISIREVVAFMAAMVVAGIMGTAITADLGSRVIREEISAFRVLGLDAERLLVVPKMLALVVMTALLAVVSVAAVVACGALVGTVAGDVSFAAYWDSLLRNITAPDLVNLAVKTALMGFVIGVVHSYKGLNVSAGPEAVGRAVNQSVVITFIGIFIVNLGMNAFSLAMYPDMNVLR